MLIQTNWQNKDKWNCKKNIQTAIFIHLAVLSHVLCAHFEEAVRVFFSSSFTPHYLLLSFFFYSQFNSMLKWIQFSSHTPNWLIKLFCILLKCFPLLFCVSLYNLIKMIHFEVQQDEHKAHKLCTKHDYQWPKSLLKKRKNKENEQTGFGVKYWLI